MANTIITANLLQKEIIRKLDRLSVITPWANRAYTGQLKKQGDTVEVQNFPNLDFDLGGTAGAALTADDWTITSETLAIDQVAQGAWKINDLEAIQSNLNLQSQIADRVAYRERDTYDRYVASFALDANASNKLNGGAPATLTTSTVITELEEMRQQLSEQNAFDDAGVFVNPAIASLIRGSNLYSGFDKGLEYRANGVLGKVAGFTVMETNNLPYAIDLQMATNPTATDTVVIAGVTFTFVASPSAAGDVDIGANVAESAANLILAVNGGAVGTAYIALSDANRQTLRRAQVNLGAFASDVGALTANQLVTTAETFTDVTDTWGTGGYVMFGMDRNSINFVLQMNGGLEVNKLTNAFSHQLQIEKAYGGKVFAENAKRIVTSEITNGTS
jgi:hypothetical protein